MEKDIQFSVIKREGIYNKISKNEIDQSEI